jgi:anti-sigma regulatory factor (Ser/Thr protein kinase)
MSGDATRGHDGRPRRLVPRYGRILVLRKPVPLWVPWVSCFEMYDGRLVLEPTPESVRRGRELVRKTLMTADPDRAEVATVLVDEMLANAVRHGEPPIVLTLSDSSGILTVEVRDSGSGLPVVRPADHDAESGRGLHIIEALADRWGVTQLHEGKAVWFQLAL